VLHLSDRELARGGARMLETGPTWSWQTNVRDKPGEVEIHHARNDIVLVQEGKAEIFLGGAVTGARTTGPGELRGGTQANPRRQVLSAGDVMFIPAGVPHRMVPIGAGRFRYMVVKTQP
jgi:mannose-6-phosphate isomerase-like protein (cupin superfamily)